MRGILFIDKTRDFLTDVVRKLKSNLGRETGRNGLVDFDDGLALLTTWLAKENQGDDTVIDTCCFKLNRLAQMRRGVVGPLTCVYTQVTAQLFKLRRAHRFKLRRAHRHQLQRQGRSNVYVLAASDLRFL